MAKQPSDRSGKSSKSNPDAGADSVATEVDPVMAETNGDGTLGGDTVLVGDGAMGDDTVATDTEDSGGVTIEPGEPVSPDSVSDEAGATEIVPEAAAPGIDEPTPSTPPSRVETRTVVERGPGIVPLVIGGIVAAGLGFGAAYMGALPRQEDGSAALRTELSAAIAAQEESLGALQTQVAALEAVEPPVIPDMPEVDLTPINEAIAALERQLEERDGTLAALGSRIEDLEARPVFTGEAGTDEAAMAAAVETLRGQLDDQTAANAEMAEQLQGLADSATTAIAAAEARAAELASSTEAAMAEAQARAEASVAAASAQAAFSRVQIAMASGGPFAEALADLPDSVDVPEALRATAATGVPTLEELQASFPAAARAALPVALRETAGDSTTDRLGAFLMGQIGGRSLEPQEGDGPDAILSRAEAAVAAGDIDGALTEISSLPEPAQAEMSAWTESARARAVADSALADLAGALDSAN